MKNKMQWIKTVILLPGNVIITIPFLLLYFTNFTYSPPALWQTVIGIILIGTGLFFAGWTMRLFYVIGKGTPAPWAPPKNLVTEGPYAYVRNPMLSGVLFILLGMAAVLNSGAILGWFAVFFLLNTLYFTFFEEKGLEKRFGNKYAEYKKCVPRWFPKLKK